MLKKQEIDEKIKAMYVLNAELDEEYMQKKRKKFYNDTVKEYGSWQDALVSNGITKRKLLEREKFILYYILKQRYEKYGAEAIRPKNVHPQEIKDRIVQSFKTLKALKNLLGEWNEDKVLYELHALFLTGATVEGLEKEQPELYEQLMEHFTDLNHALERYNKRFGLPNISPEFTLVAPAGKEEEEEEQEIQLKNDDLIDMMIRLRYIQSEEEAEAMVQAKHITKDEVVVFLFQQLTEAQLHKQKLTQDKIKQKNAPIYFAMKVHFGSLEKAFAEMTKSLVEMG